MPIDDHHTQLHSLDMEFHWSQTKSHERSRMQSHTHSHDGGEHGHTHEIWPNAGSFINREMPIEAGRDWRDRAFTVGIGGFTFRRNVANTIVQLALVYRCRTIIDPIGKTALMLALCKALHPQYNIAALTNDIFTQEVPCLNVLK